MMNGPKDVEGDPGRAGIGSDRTVIGLMHWTKPAVVK